MIARIDKEYLHFKHSDMENVTASENTGNPANIDLKEAFEMFDADDDGEITLEELQKVTFNYDGNASGDGVCF